MHPTKTSFTSHSFYWNNYFITEHTPQEPIKGQFVLLHGFPAWVSKNYDIGEQLALLGYKVYIPHHQGLGQSQGTFEFLKNLEETTRLIKAIKEKNPLLPFSLLGHSWGAYLSLRHLHEITDKLILLAPLAHFPKDSRRDLLLGNLYEKNKEDIPSYNLVQLKAAFEKLEQEMDYSVINTNPWTQRSLLIYGTNDEVIPSDLMADFASGLRSPRHTTLVTNDDHRLSKRRQILEMIKKWVTTP